MLQRRKRFQRDRHLTYNGLEHRQGEEIHLWAAGTSCKNSSVTHHLSLAWRIKLTFQRLVEAARAASRDHRSSRYLGQAVASASLWANRATCPCQVATSASQHRTLEVKGNNNNNNSRQTALVDAVVGNRSLSNSSGHLTLLQCLIMTHLWTCLKTIMTLIPMNLVSTTVRISEVACQGGASTVKVRMQDFREQKIQGRASSSKCVEVEVEVVAAAASALKNLQIS